MSLNPYLLDSLCHTLNGLTYQRILIDSSQINLIRLCSFHIQFTSCQADLPRQQGHVSRIKRPANSVHRDSRVWFSDPILEYTHFPPRHIVKSNLVLTQFSPAAPSTERGSDRDEWPRLEILLHNQKGWDPWAQGRAQFAVQGDFPLLMLLELKNIICFASDLICGSILSLSLIRRYFNWSTN